MQLIDQNQTLMTECQKLHFLASVLQISKFSEEEGHAPRPPRMKGLKGP